MSKLWIFQKYAQLLNSLKQKLSNKQRNAVKFKCNLKIIKLIRIVKLTCRLPQPFLLLSLSATVPWHVRRVASKQMVPSILDVSLEDRR